MRRFAQTIAAATLALSGPAQAWGVEGHEVVALIARAELTPVTRARVDALLAQDLDTLTAHDMAAEATWADAYRSAGHRETAEWHFVDNELDHPDLKAACFGEPAPPQPASAGPPHDCVVDKVHEFSAELRDSSTVAAERLLALKYLLHFVGDLHQPLHASDNHDRGGNCVLLSLGGTRTVNLHAYWDTTVVQALGSDPAIVAATLRAHITPSQRAAWRRGTPDIWAAESFKVARRFGYKVGSAPGCSSSPTALTLPPGYAGVARATASVQLERAGIRLGHLLNIALAH